MLKALTHLNLLDREKPSNAAILLFGKEPQRFLITSEVKCMHFHSIEVRKPIPSYQNYRGTVFDMVDQVVESGVELVVESKMAIQILQFLKESKLSKHELAEKLGKLKPTRYLNDLTVKLMKTGWIEYTIPGKPNSRLQKYFLTQKGLAFLAQYENKVKPEK